MARTTQPLVWDFWRAVDEAEGSGGIVDYFTDDAQALFPGETGLETMLTEVTEGHWEDTVYAEKKTVDAGDYRLLSLDHPAPGVVFGAALVGDELVFLQYRYSMDVGQYLVSGTWKSVGDSPVAQGSFTLTNPGEAIFDSAEEELLTPGARLEVAVAMGDSERYPIGVLWLDEADYDALSPTAFISGRNTIGYFLADQTFDDTTSLSGNSDTVVRAIFDLGGLEKTDIQPGDEVVFNWTFQPDMSLLEGIEKMKTIYTRDWKLQERADGTVVMGYTWYSGSLRNGVYVFGKNEVSRRKVRKNADGAYSGVRVTGQDEDGAELQPVYVAVPNFSGWRLGEHKTKHAQAADNMTQAQLQDYAEELAEELQYVGISETYESQLRPQLLCGDIASQDNGDGTSTDLGIVTSVTHKLGRTGFFTSFTVDSGGVSATEHGYDVSRTPEIYGYNRTQNLKDLVGVMVTTAGGYDLTGRDGTEYDALTSVEADRLYFIEEE